MGKTITIQPGQPGEGMGYNVMKSLPYPWHIAENGDVRRQDYWKGDPFRLIGFQNDVEIQRVDLMLEDWLKDPQQAVGKFPVFIDSGGGMSVRTVPITGVIVNAPLVVDADG